MNLGECYACQGPLCVTTRNNAPAIVCERCGNDQPSNPHLAKLVADAAAMKAVPPSAIVIPPSENMGALPDRLTILERTVKVQGEQIAALQALVTAEETLVGRHAAETKPKTLAEVAPPAKPPSPPLPAPTHEKPEKHPPHHEGGERGSRPRR